MPTKDPEKKRQQAARRRAKPEHKAYMHEYHRKWRASHADQIHASERRFRVKKLYAITEEEFQAMSDKQSGLCRLCSGPPGKNRTRLSIDHDHKTGKVRGLICIHCNLLLGHAKDNADLLDRCAEYLRGNLGVKD